MSFSKQPYYKLLRSFARSIGRWPEQSRLQTFVIGVIIITAFILNLTPIITADVVHFDDQKLIFETIGSLLTNAATLTVYFNTFLNGKKLRILFKRINDDWKLVTNRREIIILKKYAKLGSVISAGYAGFVYIATFIFVIEPALPMIINFIFKTNISAPYNFSCPMEWVIIDKRKYYWILFTNSTVCVMLILSVLISCDVIFITFVHHACSLFAIAGYRLQNLPTDVNLNSKLTQSYLLRNSHDVHYIHLVSSIKIHRRAIEYFNLIENTFTVGIGVVVFLNVPLMSITGVQLIVQTNTLQQKIKLIVFAVAQIIHLFFECFLSQQLTDMSLQIQRHIANGKWYNISKKSQKLLILMTLRSQVPCILTAGKIMELSIESFGMMMKTSGSYFTVLLSMQ
ncbi:odorant receptor 67c-like [Microplitis demolitor]|uniref:odorant receptor 67c-like n=1 Tax=Microplitis demolitor TaxID=69319 RepID=UPI0006D4FA8A|nr:odorant receptor 67c-like [Microplitis demolitor]